MSSSLPYLVRFIKDLKKMGDLKTWENRLKSQLALIRVVQVSEWIIEEEMLVYLTLYKKNKAILFTYEGRVSIVQNRSVPALKLGLLFTYEGRVSIVQNRSVRCSKVPAAVGR
jgi:hypothetical protein